MKSMKKQEIFSIRKMTLGVGSVLIAASMIVPSAQADSVADYTVDGHSERSNGAYVLDNGDGVVEVNGEGALTRVIPTYSALQDVETADGTVIPELIQGYTGPGPSSATGPGELFNAQIAVEFDENGVEIGREVLSFTAEDGPGTASDQLIAYDAYVFKDADVEAGDSVFGLTAEVPADVEYRFNPELITDEAVLVQEGIPDLIHYASTGEQYDLPDDYEEAAAGAPHYVPAVTDVEVAETLYFDVIQDGAVAMAFDLVEYEEGVPEVYEYGIGFAGEFDEDAGNGDDDMSVNGGDEAVGNEDDMGEDIGDDKETVVERAYFEEEVLSAPYDVVFFPSEDLAEGEIRIGQKGLYEESTLHYQEVYMSDFPAMSEEEFMDTFTEIDGIWYEALEPELRYEAQELQLFFNASADDGDYIAFESVDGEDGIWLVVYDEDGETKDRHYIANGAGADFDTDMPMFTSVELEDGSTLLTIHNDDEIIEITIPEGALEAGLSPTMTLMPVEDGTEFTIFAGEEIVGSFIVLDPVEEEAVEEEEESAVESDKITNRIEITIDDENDNSVGNDIHLENCDKAPGECDDPAHDAEEVPEEEIEEVPEEEIEEVVDEEVVEDEVEEEVVEEEVVEEEVVDADEEDIDDEGGHPTDDPTDSNSTGNNIDINIDNKNNNSVDNDIDLEDCDAAPGECDDPAYDDEGEDAEEMVDEEVEEEVIEEEMVDEEVIADEGDYMTDDPTDSNSTGNNIDININNENNNAIDNDIHLENCDEAPGECDDPAHDDEGEDAPAPELEPDEDTDMDEDVPAPEPEPSEDVDAGDDVGDGAGNGSDIDNGDDADNGDGVDTGDGAGIGSGDNIMKPIEKPIEKPDGNDTDDTPDGGWGELPDTGGAIGFSLAGLLAAAAGALGIRRFKQ